MEESQNRPAAPQEPPVIPAKVHQAPFPAIAAVRPAASGAITVRVGLREKRRGEHRGDRFEVVHHPAGHPLAPPLLGPDVGDHHLQAVALADSGDHHRVGQHGAPVVVEFAPREEGEEVGEVRLRYVLLRAQLRHPLLRRASADDVPPPTRMERDRGVWREDTRLEVAHRCGDFGSQCPHVFARHLVQVSHPEQNVFISGTTALQFWFPAKTLCAFSKCSSASEK
eukprot:gene4205-biopygen3155